MKVFIYSLDENNRHIACRVFAFSVFALANKQDELEFELSSMASLLAKFRIDYTDLQLISDITKKPQDVTQKYFDSVIKDFMHADAEGNGKPPNNLYVLDNYSIRILCVQHSKMRELFAVSPALLETITEDDLIAVQDKTNRHLRLREYLMANSSASDLVVMTLPMPRKNIVSAPLYMAWLECLSRDQPPFLFVRGNQSSVLTFYS